MVLLIIARIIHYIAMIMLFMLAALAHLWVQAHCTVRLDHMWELFQLTCYNFR